MILSPPRASQFPVPGFIAGPGTELRTSCMLSKHSSGVNYVPRSVLITQVESLDMHIMGSTAVGESKG